jgi:hypothetical protein
MLDIRIFTPLRRTGRLAVVAALCATALPLAFPPAKAAPPLFEEIGTLDRFPDDARQALGAAYVPTWEQVTDPVNNDWRARIGAIMIPEVRQLWQIYYTRAPLGTPAKTAAVVRDLDTLKIVKIVTLPEPIARDTVSAGNGGDWTHVVDVVHQRLFLVTDGGRSVLEIDLRTFVVLTRQLPPAKTSGLFLAVGGQTYDPFRDDLLLLYGGPSNQSASNTNTFLYTLDVSVPPADPLSNPFRQVRSCTGPLTSTDIGGDLYNWEILVTEDLLYIPCHRAGYTGIVVRTTRATSSDPAPPEDSAAGPVYVENALADQKAGRLVMTTIEREIWTFEAATMSFVGIVATGPAKAQGKTSYGLDRATGRIFFQSPNFGLGVVEGRYFPLPQARRMDHRVPARERILSDARTNRVFVLEQYGKKDRYYRIYRVQPASTPPAPPDPDRNTADVPEQSGVTEARFFASGSGYGARVVMAKGFSTVVPAPPVGVLAPTADVIVAASPACGFNDREMVAGRVFKAEYDTGSTAAEAIAVDVDGGTKQDLDKPSRCDVRGLVTPLDQTTQSDDPNTKNVQESRWKWQRASCATSQGDANKVSTGTQDDFGPSTVSCPSPGGTLTATGTASLKVGGTQVPELVTVGKAWTSTTIERVAGIGLRSTVEAVAQDVRLALPGATVTFAEIRSVATSAANGRPQRDHMSMHRVFIRSASIGDTVACGDICEGEDLTGLMDALNTLAAGRAQFRTGTGEGSGLDRGLVRGSQRGAQTAVQKSQARQSSDRALTGDFTVEVPGLEVTTFNDNTVWGRARQLYQFAGVASAVTYNIVAQPTGQPFVDLGPFEGPFAGAESDDTTVVETIEVLIEDEESTFDGTSAAATAESDKDNRGGFWAPFRAVARGLRLFFTDPRHSLLLLTAWALLSLPGILSRRRRLLVGTRTG